MLLRLNCSANTDRKLIVRGSKLSTRTGNAPTGHKLTRLVSCAFYVWRPLIDVLAYPRTMMSAVASTSTSHSKFVAIFNAALETYRRKTKKDLASHPLLLSLQTCDSPEAILTVLREQIPPFSRSKDGDGSLTKWIAPTVNVLYAFSATVGGSVGLVNINILLVKNFCSNICFFRHFLQRMQSLRASAFSSWSASFITTLCCLF